MKIKYILLIGGFLSHTLFSCKDVKDETWISSEFLHIVDYSEGTMIDTLTFLSHRNKVDNKFHYAYTTKDNSIYYDIDFEKCEGQYHNLKDTCALIYRNKKKYTLYPEQKNVEVFLFSNYLPETDGGFDFYFIPSIGLMLRKSTTWHDIMHLCTINGNSVLNDSLKLLIPLIYMDICYSKDSVLTRIPQPPPVKLSQIIHL